MRRITQKTHDALFRALKWSSSVPEAAGMAGILTGRARYMINCWRKNPEEYGQTVFHAPRGRGIHRFVRELVNEDGSHVHDKSDAPFIRRGILADFQTMVTYSRNQISALKGRLDDEFDDPDVNRKFKAWIRTYQRMCEDGEDAIEAITAELEKDVA